ncbi:hypothetical protein KR52_05695 [Synechococcus sp. KORDI-52]|nr:hypothetical protein KR52_05695 [Synechococcus sp. KORDI-52]
MACLGIILGSHTAAMDPLNRAITNDTLLRGMKAVELIRELHPVDLPCQVVSSFLYISSHNACHKQALEQDLDLTPASGSRITAWLSRNHRLEHKKGFRLIEKIRDPSNGRRQILVLTQKGRELANQIEAELQL